MSHAPRLGRVELDPNSLGSMQYPEFVQYVDESVNFNGRQFIRGVDPWIDGILYPDHLGIGFTERLADVPQFVRGVQLLTGQQITSIQGTASIAGLGDPLLLGDWIRTGIFQPDRLAHRFDLELGGTWKITTSLKKPRLPQIGYWVTINRVTGI